MVAVKVVGATYVLKLWLAVGKDMLFAKYFCANNSLFASVEVHGDYKTATRLR